MAPLIDEAKSDIDDEMERRKLDRLTARQEREEQRRRIGAQVDDFSENDGEHRHSVVDRKSAVKTSEIRYAEISEATLAAHNREKAKIHHLTDQLAKCDRQLKQDRKHDLEIRNELTMIQNDKSEIRSLLDAAESEVRELRIPYDTAKQNSNDLRSNYRNACEIERIKKDLYLSVGGHTEIDRTL